MTTVSELSQARTLLHEFERGTNSAPLRLRVLNMLTYSLDMVYIQIVPQLIAEARTSHEAAGRLRDLAGESQEILNRAVARLKAELLPAFESYGIRTLSVEKCDAAQRAWLDDYFLRTVRPLLTPLAVDAGRPFPQISTHSLNLLAVLRNPNDFDVDLPSFARLKVPRRVPRLIPVQSEDASAGSRPLRSYVLSEDMVRANVETLFPGMSVTGVYQFRILRGTIDAHGLPVGRHTALARQKAWPVVRLDVEQNIPDWVLLWLQENMEATSAVVLRREAPLGAGSLALEWAERATLLSIPAAAPAMTNGATQP